MISCPGCKANNLPDSNECGMCGLIYNKWLKLNPGQIIQGLESPKKEIPPAPASLPKSAPPGNSSQNLGSERFKFIYKDEPEKDPYVRIGMNIFIAWFGIGFLLLAISMFNMGGWHIFLGLLFLAPIAWYILRKMKGSKDEPSIWNMELTAYENGIMFTDHNSTKIMYWDDIKYIFLDRVTTIHLIGGKTRSFDVKFEDSKQFIKNLMFAYEEIQALHELALAKTLPRLLNEANSLLSAGQIVDFFRFRINQENFFCHEDELSRAELKPVPWGTINNFYFKEGILYIVYRDGNEHSVAKAGEIGNMEIFIELSQNHFKIPVQ